MTERDPVVIFLRRMTWIYVGLAVAFATIAGLGLWYESEFLKRAWPEWLRVCYEYGIYYSIGFSAVCLLTALIHALRRGNLGLRR